MHLKPIQNKIEWAGIGGRRRVLLKRLKGCIVSQEEWAGGKVGTRDTWKLFMWSS